MPDRKLYLQIQTLTAGHTVAEVIQALADSMAGTVGFACESPEKAAVMLDGLAKDMAKTVAQNWEIISEVRAQPRLHRTALDA